MWMLAIGICFQFASLYNPSEGECFSYVLTVDGIHSEALCIEEAERLKAKAGQNSNFIAIKGGYSCVPQPTMWIPQRKQTD